MCGEASGSSLGHAADEHFGIHAVAVGVLHDCIPRLDSAAAELDMVGPVKHSLDEVGGK